MVERATLIRPQVIAHRGRREYSSPLFQQQALVRILVWLAILLLGVAIALLALTRYKVTESARGLLESSGGSYRVVAPAPAVISQIMVESGQWVTAGQVLALLRRTSFTVNGRDGAEEELDRLAAQQALLEQEQALLGTHAAARQGHLSRAIADLEASLRLSAAEAQLTQSQLDRSETNLQALRRLRAQRAITSTQLDQAWVEHVNFKLRLQDVLQRRQATAAQLDLQRAQQAELAAETMQRSLQLQQERERLDQARVRLVNESNLGLIAATPGVVSLLAIAVNQAVAAGQPLFHIENQDAPLQATLYVPSRLHGKLRPGQELLLHYDAFDYQHYGRYRATISVIAGTSLDPRTSRLPIPLLQEPVFEISADLDQAFVAGPQIYPLQAGMTFGADIVFEEMSLLEYLFRPLFELRERVS